MVHDACREPLVRQRTMLVNALVAGQEAEMGFSS
jgi:hypothetical protein